MAAKSVYWQIILYLLGIEYRSQGWQQLKMSMPKQNARQFVGNMWKHISFAKIVFVLFQTWILQLLVNQD